MNDQLDRLSKACEASEDEPIRKSINPTPFQLGKARIETEKEYFTGGGSNQAAGQCASDPYPHFRNLIDRLIDYHNRQSNNLHALLRALPQDMSRDAMQALYDLAKTQLTRIG